MFKVGDRVRVKPLKKGEKYIHDGQSIFRPFQGEIGTVQFTNDFPFVSGVFPQFSVVVRFPSGNKDRFKEEELEIWNGLIRAVERCSK